MYELTLIKLINLFVTIFVALMTSGALGTAIATVLQLGKILLPKVFADGTVSVWRLGIICVLAFGAWAAPYFDWNITVDWINLAAVNVTKAGVFLTPFLIWFADWVSHTFYVKALKGKAVVGKSYSLDKKRAEGAKQPK